MPINVVVPKLGLTMEEGTIVEWKKTEGEQVDKGEILFVLESEKVSYEVESPAAGVLGKVLIPVNEAVPVGEIVACLLLPGERASALDADLREAEPEKGSVESTETAVDAPASSDNSQKETAGTGRVKATPVARKIAKQQNIDLKGIQGSGPGGKIVKKDIEKALEESPKSIQDPAPRSEEEPLQQKITPLTGMRRAISKKMMASKTETAQTYMSLSIDASEIISCRKSLLPYIQEKYGVRLTITDIIMKITGAVITEHPILNTRWDDKGILYQEDVHMGMAMAIADGLIVPVIRNVNAKGLGQIAIDREELIRKGKEGTFLPDDIAGSTFTVSSLGMFGIEQFTANINIPESAILAVGAIIDKPVAVERELTVRPVMKVTLSYDHRSIDGVDAAKFMETLKRIMENPVQMCA